MSAAGRGLLDCLPMIHLSTDDAFGIIRDAITVVATPARSLVPSKSLCIVAQSPSDAFRAGESPRLSETGRWVVLPRELLPPSPFTRLKEHVTMQAALAPRGDSRTWLTHFVGSGLDD